jgi:hypothetical protein
MNRRETERSDEKTAPAEPVLTPSQRRDLEIAFAKALDASSDRRREYALADELFRQCLKLDAGNALIVTPYLENLARRYGRVEKSSWGGWWRERGVLRSQYPNALIRYHAALEALSQTPSIRLLEVLAQCCRELDHDLAEEAYLREILKRDERYAAAHARLAELRIAQADFETARHHLEVIAGAIATPHADACLEVVREEAVFEVDAAKLASAEPQSVSELLLIAKDHIRAERFSHAEAVLAAAQRVHGEALALRECREDVERERLACQFHRLQSLEEAGNRLAALARRSLYQKLNRITLEHAGSRADRYPDDWDARLTLVEELIRVGHYFEAIRRLQEPPSPPPGRHRAQALRRLAESQQRLRRFDEALAAYRDLLQDADFQHLPHEDQLQVKSQCDRLAAAMGQA